MTQPQPADLDELPPGRPAESGRGKALARFAVLVVLVAAGFAVLRWTPLGSYFNERSIVTYRDLLRHSWWAAPALVLSYVLLCPVGFPASPLMIAGGVVFGAVWGSIYNLVGTSLGGAATYFLGRLLGRDFIAQVGGRRLKRIERLITRRGFWGMVGIRFLPFPFALVNYTAALAGIRPALFLTTTVIGLTPTNVLYTYFTAAFFAAAGTDRARVYLRLMIATTLLAALIFLPQIWMARQRKRRYEALLEERRRGGQHQPFASAG